MGFHSWMLKKVPILMAKNDERQVKFQLQREYDVNGATDIAFIDDGHKHHTLDVWMPKNMTGKLPVIIDVHGGAWMYGDKNLNRRYASTLAEGGFVVVCMSYRLIPEVDITAQVQDVFAAFNWVEKHIEEYGGDLNNVFLCGDSAGGHLVGLALSAMADESVAKQFGVKSDLKIRAAGMTCAVTDIEAFTKLRFIPIIRYLHKMFLGKGYMKNPKLKLLTVRNNGVKDFPPIFMNSCYGDFMKSQVKAFYKYCKDIGLETDLFFVEKEDAKNNLQHVYNILYPEYDESKATNEAQLAFFRKHLAE